MVSLLMSTGDVDGDRGILDLTAMTLLCIHRGVLVAINGFAFGGTKQSACDGGCGSS